MAKPSYHYWNEIRSLLAHRTIRVGLLGVIVIPLVYSYIYLVAFFDPYEKLENLPFAIVNEDQGATIQNEKVDLGKDLVDRLHQERNIKWEVVTMEEMQRGFREGTFYFGLEIPKTFSEQVSSLTTNKPSRAQIRYYSNESANYISGRLGESIVSRLESSVEKNITLTYLEKIFSKVVSSTGELQKAADGAKKLAEATKKAESGAKKIADGTKQLAGGSKRLQQGIHKLHRNVQQTTEKIQNAADQIDLKQVLQLLTEIEEINQRVQELEPHPRLTLQVAEKLQKARSLLEKGDQLLQAPNNLFTGVKQLDDGAKKLVSGIEQLQTGANQLVVGLTQIRQGQTQLATSLEKDVQQAQASLLNLPTKESIISDPIRVHTESIHPVPNYATGFAPYFISLSLWVGSMILYTVLDLYGVPTLLQKETISLPTSYLVGALQAIISLSVLTMGLGITPQSTILLFGFSILISWTFMTINQMLTLTLQNVGRFLSIILLMLQLTSSAGTYPIELVPRFFQSISPFLPMTYAVGGLRNIISSGNFNMVYRDFGILVLFLIGSAILGYLGKKKKSTASSSLQ